MCLQWGRKNVSVNEMSGDVVSVTAGVRCECGSGSECMRKWESVNYVSAIPVMKVKVPVNDKRDGFGRQRFPRVTEGRDHSALHLFPALKSLERPRCVVKRHVLFLMRTVTRYGPPVPRWRSSGRVTRIRGYFFLFLPTPSPMILEGVAAAGGEWVRQLFSWMLGENLNGDEMKV